MAAVTVTSSVPAISVLVDQDVLDRIDLLSDRAHLCPLSTIEEKAAAEALFAELRAISSSVERKRQELKAPALAFGSDLDAAAKQYQEVLKPTIDALGRRIQAFVDNENRKLEEARRAAAAEAAAKQKEADAKAEAEHAAAVTERAPWEDAPAPVEHIPERIVTAYVPPPMASTVVRAATGNDLVIDDPSKIPFEFQGVRLWKEPDKTMIKKLLENNKALTIPGCRLVPKGGIAAKGGAR